MSEDVYAKPDLTKKVRFQTGDKEDKDADICDNVDDVVIYDNYWAEGSTPPKSQENTTDTAIQQQTTSVNVNSEKRNLLKAPAVFLGLLCLVLLAAVVVLVILLIQDKNNWNMERNQLWMDIANLTNTTEKLQTNYSEVERINYNLTQKISQLEDEKHSLEANNNNLTTERDELRKQIVRFEESYKKLTEEKDKLEEQLILYHNYTKEGWIYFNDSVYHTSSERKIWEDSRSDCQQRGADLVIINSKEEQEFVGLTNSHKQMWIGLTYKEHKGNWNWKWVDETKITLSYWNNGEPNNAGGSEHCAEISTKTKKWNDARCNNQNFWICEKKCLFT